MARTSQAEAQIPASGVPDVPYAGHAQIARGFMANAGEMFFQEVTGAGGAGATIADLPFDAACVFVWNGDTPAPSQVLFPSGKAINLVTAAEDAGPDITLSADRRTVTLSTTLVPDADEAQVLVLGFRDVNGSE